MTTARERLALYNGDIYDSGTNPYGLDGVGGMDANFAQALADVAEVGADAGAVGAAVSVVRQTFSTTITDADPGAGTIRLNNATQGSATLLYMDLADVNGADVTSIIEAYDDSTSTIKGRMRIAKEGDTSKWIDFNVTGSVTTATGYRKVTVAYVAKSGVDPFANGDALAIGFIAKGDVGEAGPAFSTAASETVSGIAELATQTETNTGTDDARIVTPLKLETRLAANVIRQGKHQIPIPAVSWKPRYSNGCAALAQAEGTAARPNRITLDFDASTEEFAQFVFPAPTSWNEGTITFQVGWSHPSTTTNFGVVWALRAVAVSDGDATDVAYGTEQTSTDTGGTTDMLYVSPESSAITVAGSPAAGDMVCLELSRKVANASDTMAVDARVHWVRIYITIDAGTDA